MKKPSTLLNQKKKKKKIHEGSPAAESKLIRVGDQILKIHGKSIIGLTTPEVVDMLKKIDDAFVLSIRRPNT